MLKAKREQLRFLIFGVTPTFSLNPRKGLSITIHALIFETYDMLGKQLHYSLTGEAR